jgi:uncharacterized membrane protein (UPF0127 family)
MTWRLLDRAGVAPGTAALLVWLGPGGSGCAPQRAEKVVVVPHDAVKDPPATAAQPEKPVGPQVQYFPARGLLTLAHKPSVQFRVELALTAAERSRGLMYRPVVPADTGMLFDMGRHDVHSFWMRNTWASLDMVFLDKALQVVGWLEQVPTRNDAPRSIGKPSWYVLELAAGTAKAVGLQTGMQFVLTRTPDGAANVPP